MGGGPGRSRSDPELKGFQVDRACGQEGAAGEQGNENYTGQDNHEPRYLFLSFSFGYSTFQLLEQFFLEFSGALITLLRFKGN